MITITPKIASEARYHPLTIPYALPREQDMLDNVLADMRRGNIDHVLVKDWWGVAVWRRGSNQLQAEGGRQKRGRRAEDSAPCLKKGNRK